MPIREIVSDWVDSKSGKTLIKYAHFYAKSGWLRLVKAKDDTPSKSTYPLLIKNNNGSTRIYHDNIIAFEHHIMNMLRKY